MCDKAAQSGESHNDEDSPYMSALLYLQTDLAQVTDPASQQEFLACMGYLLAGQKPNKSENLARDEDAESEMIASQLLSLPEARESKIARSGVYHIDKALWARRTKVFEDITSFFPEDAVQPREDLVSCTSAWESLL